MAARAGGLGSVQRRLHSALGAALAVPRCTVLGIHRGVHRLRLARVCGLAILSAQARPTDMTTTLAPASPALPESGIRRPPSGSSSIYVWRTLRSLKRSHPDSSNERRTSIFVPSGLAQLGTVLVGAVPQCQDVRAYGADPLAASAHRSVDDCRNAAVSFARSASFFFYDTATT